nr:unnamed protein product [Digitaria exilis]
MESLQLLDDGNGSPAEPRWCAVTGGRGFLARHLVAALLRSGEWRVRVADLAPGIVLGPDETEQLLGDALRDGRAIYAPADVCNLEQLTKGDGKNYDDFVYVENVVHAHMCAERALRTKEGAKISGGKAYFVTNMEQMNLWDFNYMVQEELGYKRFFL